MIQIDILSVSLRWLIKKMFLISTNLSLSTTNKEVNRGFVWDNPVPDIWLSVWLNFLSSCWLSLVAFGKFSFQNLLLNQLFESDFCVVQPDTFYHHQVCEQATTKNRVFKSLVAASDTGKLQYILNSLKIGTFQPHFDKLFKSTLPAT